MRSTMSLSCLLACALSACASEPAETTTNNDSSGTGGTGGSSGTGDTPTTGASSSTGEDATTTAESSTGAVSSTGADDSSTGAVVSTGDSSETSDSSTGDSSETGDSDTGDSSTGSTSDSSTSDSSTGEPDGLGQAAQDVVLALEAATEGVYFLSESDYPWVVVAFADAAPVSEASVKDVIAGAYVPHDEGPTLAERAIELRTLAQLMDPLTVPQGWWTQENFDMAAQYQPIRDIFEMQLADVQVFRFGKLFGDDLMGAIDVYVLGETADGDVVGMWTVAVET